MNADKVIEVLGKVRENVRAKAQFDIKPERADITSVKPGDFTALSHVLWMCDETEGFVKAGRMEKAFRWLGFIQGVLWMTGVASIDESKHQNMPDAPEVPPEGTPLS